MADKSKKVDRNRKHHQNTAYKASNRRAQNKAIRIARTLRKQPTNRDALAALERLHREDEGSVRDGFRKAGLGNPGEFIAHYQSVPKNDKGERRTEFDLFKNTKGHGHVAIRMLRGKRVMVDIPVGCERKDRFSNYVLALIHGTWQPVHIDNLKHPPKRQGFAG